MWIPHEIKFFLQIIYYLTFGTLLMDTLIVVKENGSFKHFLNVQGVQLD